jgi:peroxiredoxin
MKTLKLLLALPGLLALQNAMAQQPTHLALSDQYPAAGENISISYDAAGTALDGKKDISGAVYFLDNKDYPVSDITFTADGKLMKGSFTVPDSAKAFYVKLSSSDVVDNNNDAGYVYLVYKNQQPVPGAYASEAYMLNSGMGTAFAKIKKINTPDALILYKKEFALYPSSKSVYGNSYYYMIARSTDPADVADVNTEIANLEKSGTEKDLSLATTLLTLSKRKPQADSISAIVKTKYPNGDDAKFAAYRVFYSEKDLGKKDSLYTAFIAQFPEKAGEKNSLQDNMRVALAGAYLTKGDMAGYNKYAAMVENKKNLAGELNNTAWAMAEKGDKLPDAEKLSKQSLDYLQAGLNSPEPMPYYSPKAAIAMNQSTYDTYADTYAYILYKEGRYAEALKYQQDVYDHNTLMDADLNEHYVLILNALGRYADAKKVAEANVKAGKSTSVMKDELKKDYTKLNGSDKGFDTYVAALEADAKAKAHADLAATMINQPAPQFTLKDIDGNTVTLNDLKGKIVIVDFWATWCGPCKASFPGMQLAVNKYKDDPNVKFLFVDCWETDANYVDGVKKFIADNKYSFHVLIDEKGSDGRQSKVVSSYDVSGIPTKFIIDKSGNIRFKYIGYDGTPEGLLDEVTNMINMTANPPAASVSAQNSGGSN